MAVAKVQKVLIISHQSQSQQLIAAIQKAGIVHLLEADNASVIKADAALKAAAQKDRDADETFLSLEKAIAFLKQHYTGKPLATIFSPKAVVDDDTFIEKAGSRDTLSRLNETVALCVRVERLHSELEAKKAKLAALAPWKAVNDDVESFKQLENVDAFVGIVPATVWGALSESLAGPQSGAVVNVIKTTKTQVYAAVLAMKDKSQEIYKLLRANEFEAAAFEGLKGTISDNMDILKRHLHSINEELISCRHQAHKLTEYLLDMQMMYDYYANKRLCRSAFNSSAATQQTRIFEGWVRQADMGRLTELALGFDAVSVCPVRPQPGEAVPVDIENKSWAKPFEVITRLYGVPRYFEFDPTVFFAPFFALFFALCLTDAGYGLVMIAAAVYLLRKLQTGKSFTVLILICSVLTVFAGAMTGGWFGSTLYELAVKFKMQRLEWFITKTTWFNPLEDPMTFLVIAVILGYIQIMAGLVVGFFSVLKNNGFFAAVFDKLVWLVLLNSIAVMGAAKSGFAPRAAGSAAVALIYLSAASILCLSHREGGVGVRLGMGAYNLFTAIFYLGDLLSYLRLMALGMATGGVAMAINIIGGIIAQTPYVGTILAIIFIILGHIFNMLQSILGSFVHSMRLQFVEFFPKFMEGGGMPFEPFSEKYRYVYIKQEEESD